jgi:SAM-dependent methyltransferase
MIQARCPLCSSSRVDFVQGHADFTASAIHHCSDCSFWFGAPVPSEPELSHYYRTTYARNRTWAGSPEYIALMQRRAAAQRKFIGLELPEIHSALDVGCGVGALVVELRRFGVEAVGYDSDESVIRIGRMRWGANIHTGGLVGAEEGKRFDLLCLSHVVEHFRAPVTDLETLAHQVRPGGWLLVEVPQTLPWVFDSSFNPESHLGFHTAKSLGILSRAAGLEVVRLRNCGPFLTRLPVKAMGPWWKRIGPGVRRRAAAGLGRFFQDSWPVRTVYDGYFDRYHGEGDERGTWLRALLRRPMA